MKGNKDQNKINDNVELSKDILDAIKKSKTSGYLSLCGKKINDSQAVEILKLSVFYDYIEVNFHNNEITDEGAKTLAKYGRLYFKYNMDNDSDDFLPEFYIGNKILLSENNISTNFKTTYIMNASASEHSTDEHAMNIQDLHDFVYDQFDLNKTINNMHHYPLSGLDSENNSDDISLTGKSDDL